MESVGHLREAILLAEDTEFTAEQGAWLAPRLLEFAERHRDSDDPQDKSVVFSAIRTGSSMLRPVDARLLLPLLESGHPIETGLVALKMLGRVFEAQPPAGVDQHEALAREVLGMAGSLLNRHAIATGRGAAMAQLAVYALAAMGSSDIVVAARLIRQLDVEWFIRRTTRKMRELGEFWQSRRCNVASEHRGLVADAITKLLT